MSRKHLRLFSIFAINLIFVTGQKADAFTKGESEIECSAMYAKSHFHYSVCIELLQSYKKEDTGEFSVRHMGSEQNDDSYREIVMKYFKPKETELRCYYHGDDGSQCGMSYNPFPVKRSCTKCYWGRG